MTVNKRYAEMFKGDRVDPAVYTSREIFEEEIKQIFHKTWLYIGHESEIGKPGDFRMRPMGRHSVIMVRDNDGKVGLLLNRCIHRGNEVCVREAGNARFFRCAYHGWTYNLRGDLTGVPLQDAYDASFREERPGLVPVPRIGVYRGFVFGSLSPSGMEFDEWLTTPAKEKLDSICDVSPEGEIELSAGVTKSIYRANWKLMGMDGYHAPVTHKVPIELMKNRKHAGDDRESKRNARDLASFSEERKVAPGSIDRSKGLTRGMGHGQVMLDFRPVRERMGDEIIESLREKSWGPAYIEAMERRHGKERARRFLIHSGDPHMGIFPNFQFVGVHIRVLHPISPDLTEVNMYPVMVKGAPEEMNVERLRDHEWFYTNCSFGTPDDYEMFERSQRAMQGDYGADILLARGLKRELHDEEGAAGDFSDEVTQRGQLEWWAELMSAGE